MKNFLKILISVLGIIFICNTIVLFASGAPINLTTLSLIIDPFFFVYMFFIANIIWGVALVLMIALAYLAKKKFLNGRVK